MEGGTSVSVSHKVSVSASKVEKDWQSEEP